MSLPSNEEFSAIPGYEGRYAISREGTVVSFLSDPDGRKMSPTLVGGYRTVALFVGDGSKRYFRIHRLLLTTFVRPPEPGEVGRHLNDDRLDNRLENLAWGTYSDNSRDVVRNGKNYWLNKTHCIAGHELAPGNVQMVRSGKYTRRSCKACRRKQIEKYNAKPRPRATCPLCSRDMRKDHLARHQSLAHKASKEIAA